jgi:glyoxylase-like metal-dependent hydrolase (beta-lactamase superfamily II)
MPAPLVETVVVGPLEVNCHLLACAATARAAVIDPGAEGARVVARLRSLGWQPEMILQTHGHMDHWAAAADVAEAFGIPVHLHAADRFLLSAPDLFDLAPVLNTRPCPAPVVGLADGQALRLGELTIRVIHTPGHTPGGCCFLVDTACFVGDTLFAGGIGRTDLPGGDEGRLLASIRDRLLTLPPDVLVLPGHGPATTVGDEISFNPFILL